MIMLGMPAMGDINAHTCAAMVRVKGADTIRIVINSLVHDARNKLCEAAIKSNADYLFMVDSDMDFPKDTISKFVDDGYPVVTGLCVKRRDDCDPCVYDDFSPEMLLVHEDFTHGKFEVKGCGAAVMLIRVDVLREMYKKYGTWFDFYRGLGEDLSFCRRLNEMNIPILCDTTVPIAHMGEKGYTIKDWVGNRQNWKADICHNYCKHGESKKCEVCPLWNL